MVFKMCPMYRALIGSKTIIMLVRSITYILRGYGLHFKLYCVSSPTDCILSTRAYNTY